jgi:hypothetical protein
MKIFLITLIVAIVATLTLTMIEVVTGLTSLFFGSISVIVLYGAYIIIKTEVKIKVTRKQIKAISCKKV